MKKYLLLLALISVGMWSCGSHKADAQLQAAECDIMFEYHFVENDSITLLVGNTIRLHTGKTQSANFYPFLLSERSPVDLDRPISSEVFNSSAELVDFLRTKFPFHGAIGVVIGENTSSDPDFDSTNAVFRIKEIATALGARQLFVFTEKNAEITGMKTEAL